MQFQLESFTEFFEKTLAASFFSMKEPFKRHFAVENNATEECIAYLKRKGANFNFRKLGISVKDRVRQSWSFILHLVRCRSRRWLC